MNVEFVEPWYPSRRAWVILGALAAVAVTSLVTAIVLRARASDSEARAAALQRRLDDRLRAPAPASIPQPAYYADAVVALGRSKLPEAAALTELEAVSVVGIQVKSIDLDATQSRVVVELEAGSNDVLASYLDQLNDGHDPAVWHILRLATAVAPSGNSNVAIHAKTVELVREF